MSTGTDLYSTSLVHTEEHSATPQVILTHLVLPLAFSLCVIFQPSQTGQILESLFPETNGNLPGAVKSPVKPLPPCTDQSSSYKKCSNKEKAVLPADPCWVPHGDGALVVGSAELLHGQPVNQKHLLRVICSILRLLNLHLNQISFHARLF